ncbi:MAG: polyprenyl synthetase family protein [Lachnospiraceae bacterium]|nr:polyprenyl synthetase family protein [Lachnospiraceae bacterium]
MSFKEQMKEKVVQIEAIIGQYLPEEKGFQKTIFKSMNYSVQVGGKRLRPMIMQETYKLFGGEGREIEPFMAAIEMIHSSSLVHDDLPAMDNDEYRRGQLTTWKKYGEDMAILAGDALMIFAFEVAAKAFGMSAHPERVGRAIEILANKTGIYGMIGGQTVDVELTDKPMDAEHLDFIYRLKTGALLEASMMIGAVLAGASAEEVAAAEQVANDVGVAFQIQDDILDLTSTAEVLGKPIGSDEKNNKTTYVTLFGMDAAREQVAALSNRAIQTMKGLGQGNEYLEELFISLIHREK